MKLLNLALQSQSVVYVTRDLERALGLALATPNYYIISNFSAFGKRLAKKHPNVLLIKEKTLLDTHELLSHPLAHNFLKNLKNPHILVFKNTLVIENICQKENWPLLNPKAALANRIEEKISQVTFLEDAEKYLPPHQIIECKNVVWRGKPFILQFNRAHTGSGTILISSKTQLEEIKTTFPNRPVRITKFLQGTMLTNNNTVWGKTILTGNINVQITGLKPFTDRTFATVGNDWQLPHTLLTTQQQKKYHSLATAVGKKMAIAGWQGAFGIDVLLEEKTNKLYLIEINARQSANVTFESQLQNAVSPIVNSQISKHKAFTSLTTFEAHLLSLLRQPYSNQQLISIKSGAQIIQKITQKINPSTLNTPPTEHDLTNDNFTVLRYNNTEPEKDFIRIQTTKSFLKNSDTLNTNGKKIIKILKNNFKP